MQISRINFDFDYQVCDFSSILCPNQFMKCLELCQFQMPVKMRRLYLASNHGFLGENFHNKCDGHPNTLSIIQIENGNIFGGFTTKIWTSENCYVEDSQAFIFSFANRYYESFKFDLSNSLAAIYCGKNCGPSFGFADFRICNSSIDLQGSF